MTQRKEVRKRNASEARFKKHSQKSVSHLSEPLFSSMLMRSAGMMLALSAQYILGMIVNAFAGNDSQKHSLLIQTIFFAHVLVGAGIAVGSFVLLYFAIQHWEEIWAKYAMVGFVSVVVSVLAGLGTVMTNNILSDVFSFVMSVGFLGAFFAYGYMTFLFLKMLGKSSFFTFSS